MEQRERNFLATGRERGGGRRAPLAKVIRNRCWHCSIMYSRALRVALHNARNLRLISILKHLGLCAYWRGCARGRWNDAAIPTRDYNLPEYYANADNFRRGVSRGFVRITRVPFHLWPFFWTFFSEPIPLYLSERSDITASRTIKQRRVDTHFRRSFDFDTTVQQRRVSVNSWRDPLIQSARVMFVKRYFSEQW